MKTMSWNTIYIAGGEPLLDKDQENLIDTLISLDRAKDITIQYNTNLTVLQEGFLQKLLHFKKIEFIVSCDGYNNIYEYIRIGASWQDFLRNLITLQGFIYKSDIESSIVMNTVVQRDNIESIPQLYIFIKKLWDIPIILSILTGPEHLYIGNIEMNKRQKILKIYSYYEDKYTSIFPEISEELGEIIDVLKNIKPSQKYIKLYYKTRETMDEFTKVYSS